MDLGVAGMVLLAALMHAGWNGLVKARGDPLVMMAPVAALRETSVIFAALLSALVLKEGFGAMRMFSATAVTAGVFLMRI